MKLAVFNDDGERVGTISDNPFQVKTKANSEDDLKDVFGGIANATDATTNSPPVNPEQLASEGFEVVRMSRRHQLIRNTARANDYGLVPLSEV